MIFTDWQLIDYQTAWDKQKHIFNSLIDKKLNPDLDIKDITPQVILCEHPHVYTLGRNGKASNLLANEAFLQKINATFYHIDRGGDITYHGPGQLVGYPILDIAAMHLSLKDYVYRLEESIIQTIAYYGIKGSRLQGATGVWLDVDKANVRKICAIGIRASHYITMHGFALNVNTDLNYFHYINPCGFVDKGVTSIERELQRKMDMQEVKHIYKQSFINVFKV
ncbi:MAG: Octanoyltransferase [Bacteroidetes bacterium ADurb.Bin234]|jgi:lipoyl(octanoyl) transferase|nr:MAG: Octanoyltransferase [Bacteroidetes bacterium ADurb.Bin234]